MKKYLKYLSYVIRHKWFVFIECYKVDKLWRGITHDMSKFKPDEFIPYARYFYGVGTSELVSKEVQEAFDIAWLKHIHRNPHHWQHWLLQEDDGDLKTINMPYQYIKEMLADWRGADRAITGKNDQEECRNWYLKNYFKIEVSIQTRLYIDRELNIYLDNIQGGKNEISGLNILSGNSGTIGSSETSGLNILSRKT